MEQATAGQIHNQNQRQPQDNRHAVPTIGNSQLDELKGLGMMMQQLLQSQQVQAKTLNQVTTEIDTRLGNMCTELNAMYEIVASHIRKIDVQLAQTAESVKRQQGTLPGKIDKNPRTEHSTAPSEPAETPPVRVYVPKVPYPIPPRHLMDPISAEQLAGFRKMVRRLPQKISFEHAWEIQPLHMFFKNCIESQKEIKALFTEALTPSLKVLPKVDDPGNIRRFDENAWIDVVSMFGRVQSLHSDRTLARARSLRSDRTGRTLGRYRPSGTSARSLRSDRALVRAQLLSSNRALARAWSLRSDRVGWTFGRYAAADIGPDLVATPEKNTEQSASSGATAPSEPAETPPVRVYVPKVPYPIPPRHLMDPISAEQLAGFRKMVRRLPQKISFDHAWEIRPLHMFSKNCRKSQEEIKALFIEARTPSLKVLPKVDDPGKFVFPCSIAGVVFKEALCDFGSSVNLVSKAIVDELGIFYVEPSQVKLDFANSSMAVPYGTIRNLHVQVGDYVLHTEFQVIEMRKDHEMPLIFGRSFMAKVGAIVDMPNKRASFSNINKKVFYKAVPTRSQIRYASCISMVSREQPKFVPKKEFGDKSEIKEFMDGDRLTDTKKLKTEHPAL
ncbi:hypothetical protein F2Q69_00014171 [Brassica cretica]|uniref:Aspartic peptidase DDI1-type domain-containing protein n=1 Tax=Brassica cretica TaxID=69181 RepID=A0A8S9QU91_BRACR|nr:hypothetical protein F2Q69_00014171 [Brassica cretica]